MSKQRIPKPAAIALVVVALLVAGALGYFLLISPKRSAASELAIQVASTESEIQARRIAQHQQSTTTVEPIRAADLFRVTKAMPNKYDMPGVLLELNRIARETGIRFESITPQDGTDAGGYFRQPIDLVFEGNFYELSDFLYRVRTLVSVHNGELRASGRLFTVRTMSFVEGERAFPQIKASLGVDAFVYGTGDVSAAPTPTPAAEPAPGESTTPPVSPPPSTNNDGKLDEGKVPPKTAMGAS